MKSRLVKIIHFLCILITCLIFLVILIGLSTSPSVAQKRRNSQRSDQIQVFKINYVNNPDLAKISYLDIWEVDRSSQTLIAAITPSQKSWLLAQGYALTQINPLNSSVSKPNIGVCYRSVSQLYSDLQTQQAAYPDLISLQKIGLSYDNHDLWVAKITNQAISSPKPRLFVMANIHGRELITPETAFAFLNKLLQNYGKDPDITALVDWQETYILITANPDGHIKTEQNISPYGWRKNTQPYGVCSNLDYGVDLNRNHSFTWGQGLGSSNIPCDLTYSGPSAASEPETQAIESFARSIFADQRGPLITDAAPITTTGMLISLHSYGNLILWPWGDSFTQAPNAFGLSQLGFKMAGFNQFSPMQAINLYPTDGTTDQWAYGELGIAAFTYEIGSSSDGFFPTCDRYEALIQPNVNALLFAATSSYTPYQAGSGPEVINMAVTPNGVNATNSITLTATLESSTKPIQAAEIYIDIPPWAGGVFQPLQAADGGFDTYSEKIAAVLNLTPNDQRMVPGTHLVWLRSQDIDGMWGPFKVAFVKILGQHFFPVLFGSNNP